MFGPDADELDFVVDAETGVATDATHVADAEPGETTGT